jgi:DNA-binding ferritin-like protein
MKVDLLGASYASVLFAFDCWCLHHNVHGEAFKDVHEFLGEFYTRALEDRDYFVEHSILTGESNVAPNMTDIFLNHSDITHISAWNPLPAKLYSVKEAMDAVQKQWEDYEDIFKIVREHCESKGYDDIASDIDAMVSAWNLDIKYKALRTTQ